MKLKKVQLDQIQTHRTLVLLNYIYTSYPVSNWLNDPYVKRRLQEVTHFLDGGWCSLW